MATVLSALVAGFANLFRSRLALQIEVLPLRHQLAIYQRTVNRSGIRRGDRLLWCRLSRRWARWRQALVFVQPSTVIAWQRRRFRYHGSRKSRAWQPDRPAISEEIGELVGKVSGASPLWGTPRIIGELGKLGIHVAKQPRTSIESDRLSSQSSPTCTALLKNHVADLLSIDFFIVPTIQFKLLCVLVVLAYARRRVIHFNSTTSPRIQLYSGRANRSSKPFHGTAPRNTAFAIAMRSTAANFNDGCKASASSRLSAHREVRGRTRSSSG